VYEFGQDRVLRKTRDGRSIEHEARIMSYLRDHGYPVPRIDDVRADGAEIVMERIDGPMMMDAIAKRPWSMGHFGGMLADLHDELHALAAPDWLPRLPDGGDRLVHLDLHPMNVMMSARGPIVIDWANAAAGQPLTDVGFTYALLVAPDMPGPWIVRLAAQPVRVRLANAFARRYRGREFAARLAAAADLKTQDRNMSPREVDRLRRLARRARRRDR
jgi:serine/threonine protein kinase